MTMKKSKPSTIIMTTSMTIRDKCVLRVKTRTPRKTQPSEMQSVIRVLSRITCGGHGIPQKRRKGAEAEPSQPQ